MRKSKPIPKGQEPKRPEKKKKTKKEQVKLILRILLRLVIFITTGEDVEV